MTPEDVSALTPGQPLNLVVPVTVRIVGFDGAHAWFETTAVPTHRFALKAGDIHPIPDPPEQGGGVFGPYDRPLKMDRDRFIGLLNELIDMISSDDSMEGRLAYEWSDEHGNLNVHAVLRTGNSQGQGGMIMIRGQAE